MDNLVFEKIWIDSDEDFFQVKVVAKNDRITMSSEVYSQTHKIEELQSGVHNILLRPFSIVMGNDDNSSIDCVKFSFKTNKRGLVFVSIFMKTRNDENINDTANFTILTDIASLDRFSSGLRQIAVGKIGVRVQLHD